MQIQYKPKRNFLETIFQVEILQGMALTLKRLFSKPITRQYPDEKPVIKLGFRGQHALVRDPVTNTTRCIGCMRCAMVCPSRCIRVRAVKKKAEHGNRRFIEDYRIEALRCIYCAYCVEVCPVNALILTEEYEYSGYDRDSLNFGMGQLLGNWDRFIAGRGEQGRDYVNPYWRPRGVPIHDLPAAKRGPGGSEINEEEQVVGRNWKTHRKPEQSEV